MTLQMGYVAELIKSLAKNSQVVAHQLIWNMHTNMYTDEEMHNKDSEYIFYELVLGILLADINMTKMHTDCFILDPFFLKITLVL